MMSIITMQIERVSFISFFMFSCFKRNKKNSVLLKFQKISKFSIPEYSLPANSIILEQHKDNLRIKCTSEFSFIQYAWHVNMI